MQPAPAGGGAEKAALEGLKSRVAKNSANGRAVTNPALLGCNLVPGTWQHGDDTSLIGLAKFSMQRRRYRAEGGRVLLGRLLFKAGEVPE